LFLESLGGPSCKGHFAVHIGKGFFQFVMELPGDFQDLLTFGFNADGLGHPFQFKGVVNAEILDLAVNNAFEQFQDMSAVVTFLPKFLASMVSMVAPQTPTFLYGSLGFNRQGPI
jgi:hypothetical protein